MNAIAFLYNTFLQQPIGDISSFRRSTRQSKLPVVLTAHEIQSLLDNLTGAPLLMASLMYGSSLRRIELVRLRIKDIDGSQLQLRIWNGKGAKHRLVTLAAELISPLRRNHVDESALNKIIRAVAQQSNLTSQIACHTLRHSFATHSLQSWADIRTVQRRLAIVMSKPLKSTLMY